MCFNCRVGEAQEAREVHEIGECPVEPVYSKKGFSIYKGVLRHEKYSKHTGRYLDNILNIHKFKCVTEKAKWTMYASELGIEFYIAQLIFHAVEAVRIISIGQLHKHLSIELRKMLEDAVKNGECVRPSDTRTNIEKQMFEEYETMMDKWKAEKDEWLAQKARADDGNRWRSATTPQQLADKDPKAMVRLYFCNRAHKKLRRADQTITRDPIVLVNFKGDLERLKKARRRVPGLKYVVVTMWADDLEREVHGLGWDLDRVTEAVHATAKDVQQTFWAEQWAQVKSMDGHDAFVTQALEENQRFPNMAGGRPKLAELKGVFAMCVPGIREEHPRYNVVYLHISQVKGTIALAACDFGVLRGTMLLSEDSTLLQEFHDVDEGDVTMSSPVRRHHPHPPEAPCSPLHAAMKRRRVAGRGADHCASLTVNRDGEYSMAFMFRGRDILNNRIDHEPRRGTLLFSDRHLHSFRGSVEFGLPFETLTFKGYRVNGVPERALRWDTFSSEAYEKEERARLEDRMEEE